MPEGRFAADDGPSQRCDRLTWVDYHVTLRGSVFDGTFVLPGQFRYQQSQMA